MKYDIYGRPKRNNIFFEMFLFFLVFGGGSCALWYVIFRAIGILV